tara:strand:+ start:1281 stop:1775 length:495 start_codon:yes stop_codon:yes gene_type:complete
MSKFLGINYPFFGLIKKPYKVIYTLDKILIKKHENSHNETVDDKTLSGDYFSRLVNIDNRLKFNYTCRNLQDVLISNIKWGIDCKGIPHDLSVKEYVSMDKRKIIRIKGNLVWLHNISYPFVVNTKETIVVNDQLFASIVRIHNEWYIKEFTYDKDIKKAVAVV